MKHAWNDQYEQQLQRLITGNSEQSRKAIATRLKQDGKKIVGLLCTYVPREIVHAAGFVPWRITGTWEEKTPLSMKYRMRFTCRYSSHVLEALLNGQVDYLDAILTTNRDDDLKRLYDVIDYLKLVDFSYIVHLPHTANDVAHAIWRNSVKDIGKTLEQALGAAISAEALANSIATFNLQRELLGRLYELRKMERPPVSGTEMLGITTASFVMPAEEFNSALEELLPRIVQRECPLRRSKARLLVSSDMLDDLRYVEAIEECGATVVADDLDTGWRSVSFRVPDGRASDLHELYANIADAYLADRAPCPRMWNWEKQVANVIRLVKDYRVQAVIDLPALYSFPREFYSSYLKNTLQENGIPVIAIRREYQFANAGQLSTRFGAFVEMVS